MAHKYTKEQQVYAPCTKSDRAAQREKLSSTLSARTAVNMRVELLLRHFLQL